MREKESYWPFQNSRQTCFLCLWLLPNHFCKLVESKFIFSSKLNDPKFIWTGMWLVSIALKKIVLHIFIIENHYLREIRCFFHKSCSDLKQNSFVFCTNNITETNSVFFDDKIKKKNVLTLNLKSPTDRVFAIVCQKLSFYLELILFLFEQTSTLLCGYFELAELRKVAHIRESV